MGLTDGRPRYLRPRTIAAAVTELAQPGSFVIAGGTDYYPSSRRSYNTQRLVDVSGVAELGAISRESDQWRIGATVSWNQVAQAELPRTLDGLQHAARQIGGIQIQNAGTIGGNLCTASPAADSVPPLLTLDASVEMTSVYGSRVLPLSEFITGYRSTTLAPGELVTAILIPHPDDDAASAFLKLGQRSYLVISIAMVACLVSVVDRRIAYARVAVGSCSAVAQRMTELENRLKDCPATAAAIDDVIANVQLSPLEPIDDVRGSAAYRRAIVPQLISDCLATAMSTR